MRDEEHRVKNIWMESEEERCNYQVQNPDLLPMEFLESLVRRDGTITSFYETSGERKDYVKINQKIWARLLISWWALDWRVGEDKKLDRDTKKMAQFFIQA